MDHLHIFIRSSFPSCSLWKGSYWISLKSTVEIGAEVDINNSCSVCRKGASFGPTLHILIPLAILFPARSFFPPFLAAIRPAPCFVDYGGYFWLFTPVSGLPIGRKGKVRFAPTMPVVVAVQEEDLIEESIFEEFLWKILRQVAVHFYGYPCPRRVENITRGE